jgi:hypothetical protein
MPASRTSGWTVKYDGPCSKCGTILHAGSPAVWDRSARKMSCIECPPPSAEAPAPPPIEAGVAGGSARREQERRLANRETRNKERWGDRVGGWVNRFGTVPQSISAWGIGGRGEELLAAALAPAPGLIVLHDRRVPGTRGNIDHIVIAPAGVFVIDAKHYEGLIEIRNYGWFFRPDLRLTVGRRDKSKLARDMGWQIEAVKKALGDAGVNPLPPITPVLCFVDGRWPIFRPPEEFEGVRLESERSIVRLLTSTLALEAIEGDRLARILATAFPPK